MIKFLLVFAAAAPLLTGCATEGGTAMSSSMVAPAGGVGGGFAYAPAVPPSARLPAERLPKLMIGKITDESNGGEFHGPTGFRLDLAWPDIVRGALDTELGRVGWPLTRSPELAGATLKATVTKVSASWTAGFFVKVHGEVRIALILTDPSGAVVWNGEIVGTGVGVAGGGGIPGNGIRQAVAAAFNDAMPRLGAVLEQERPWDRIGKERPVAARAPARATTEVAAPVAGWSDVDAVPAPRAKRKGHAVVIGIERYRAKLPVADYAAGDAALVAKYAVAVLGYPEENVTLLTNDMAAKSDFEKYFDKWLPNRVEKDDEVLVYFSGHGSPNPATGDAFVVPYDGDPTYLEETGYPLARLYAALAKLPTKKVTVVLDSCFSGAGGHSVLAKGARPLVSVKTPEAAAGITVIAASSAEQISNSYEEKGHGLFTYFLLKGLQDKGPNLRAAFDYLKPEVAKVARKQYNADQEPQWREGR